MSNMVFRELKLGDFDYFIWMHGTEAPENDKWQASIEAMRAYVRAHDNKLDNYRGLVFTDGGAPSASQRADLNSIYGGRPVKVAVIANSAFVRAVITALTWFDLKIKAFAPREIGGALDHIGLRTTERRRLFTELKAMELECGGRITVCRGAAEAFEPAKPTQTA
jgi:hypothetical protein